MKLTLVAFRFGKRLPKGNIYRGKYRLVKPVKSQHLMKKREEYELEEENMFYLRNPYLTEEQEKDHVKLFGNEVKWTGLKLVDDVKVWKKHRLLGDRIGFLKISDKWE